MNNDFVYQFLHIPKTGGVTLLEHFKKHLVYQEELILLSPQGNKDRRKLKLPPFEEDTIENRHKAKIIIGHDVLKATSTLVEKPVQHITFLRHPADRLVSHYNYERGHYQDVPPFEIWYKRQKHNLQIFWVCTYDFNGKKPKFTRAVQVLFPHFLLVGSLESFLDDTDWLMAEIGLPPVTEKHNVTGVDHPEVFVLDEYWNNKISIDHKEDYKLWNLTQ